MEFDAELPYAPIPLPASSLSGSPMKMLILLSLFTTVAMSCGDNSYRCVNPDTRVAQDWHHTELCMDCIGISDTCWCYYRAEKYAVPTGDDIQAFKVMIILLIVNLKSCNQICAYAYLCKIQIQCFHALVTQLEHAKLVNWLHHSILPRALTSLASLAPTIDSPRSHLPSPTTISRYPGPRSIH